MKILKERLLNVGLYVYVKHALLLGGLGAWPPQEDFKNSGSVKWNLFKFDTPQKLWVKLESLPLQQCLTSISKLLCFILGAAYPWMIYLPFLDTDVAYHWIIFAVLEYFSY